MDFAKAFDKVPHKKLIRKLREYGINSSIDQWIESFSHQRQQRVVCEGEMSSWVPVTSGVSQGSVIEPILFLFSQLNYSPTFNYLQTTLLCIWLNNETDAAILQKDLKEWENRSQMSFHQDKCNVQRVKRCGSSLTYDYILHNQILQDKDAVKYPGVTVHHKLSWNQHICFIVKKTNSSMVFSHETYKFARNTSKLMHTRLLFDYKSSMRLLYGIVSPKRTKIKLTWYREELPALLVTTDAKQVSLP